MHCSWAATSCWIMSSWAAVSWTPSASARPWPPASGPPGDAPGAAPELLPGSVGAGCCCCCCFRIFFLRICSSERTPGRGDPGLSSGSACPPPLPLPGPLTLLPHPGLLALAQSAQLTLAPHEGVHLAGAAAAAGIAPSPAVDHTAPEEALAALAAQHVVMEARGLVPAHAAKLVAQHLRGWALLALAFRLLLRIQGDWGRRDKGCELAAGRHM